VTSSGAGTDSYALGYNAISTMGATDTSNSTETETYGFTMTAGDTISQSGAASFSLNETLSAQGGVAGYSISSYVFSSGQAGTFSETDASNNSDLGTANIVDTSNGVTSNSVSNGGVTGSGLGNDSVTSLDSLYFNDSSTFSASDSGSFGLTNYLAGSYANGSYAFSSLALTQSFGETWSQSGADTSNQSGTDSTTDSGNTQGSGTMANAALANYGLNNDTFTDTSTDTWSDNSSDSWGLGGSTSFSLSEYGSYSGFSYSLTSMVYNAASNNSGTWGDAETMNLSGTATDSLTQAGNQSLTGTAGVGGNTGLGTYTDSRQDSYYETDYRAIADSVSGAQTWGLYESGNYSGGSWSLNSVNYSLSATSNVSVQARFTAAARSPDRTRRLPATRARTASATRPTTRSAIPAAPITRSANRGRSAVRASASPAWCTPATIASIKT